MTFFREQLPVHSAHVGQELEVYYRWHPYFGNKVLVRQIQERADGCYVRVEGADGIVVLMATWMLDSVTCAMMTVGPPRVDWVALVELRQRLLDVPRVRLPPRKLPSFGRNTMKSPKNPASLTGPHQLDLMFDAMRTAGLDAADRQKAALALAQILMQAAGLMVEEFDNDGR